MAKCTVRADLHGPVYARNVAGSTAAILHQDSNNGGVAPPGVNVLPCGVISATAGNFIWQDVSGTTITTALAAGIYTPICPTSIDSTSVVAVTVFWQPEP